MSVASGFDSAWLSRVLLAAVCVLCACWVGRPVWGDGWVDRIEGEHAVILEEQPDGGEDWVERVVPLSDLPVGVQEGDYVSGGAIDGEARIAMLKRIMSLQQRLFERRGD